MHAWNSPPHRMCVQNGNILLINYEYIKFDQKLSELCLKWCVCAKEMEQARVSIKSVDFVANTDTPQIKICVWALHIVHIFFRFRFSFTKNVRNTCSGSVDFFFQFQKFQFQHSIAWTFVGKCIDLVRISHIQSVYIAQGVTHVCLQRVHW